MDSITFATQDNGLVFYSRTTGKVYIYSVRTGELINAWQFNRLGLALKELS